MPVFSITDPQFWFQFFRYFVCVFIGYYIPGDLVLSKISLPKMFRIPVAIIVGMVLLGFEGFITGYLHIRYASVFYIVVCAILWLIFRKSIHKHIEQYRIDVFSQILVIIGSLALLSTIWFMGITTNGSAIYCCADPNDNFYYGAISQQIIHRFPPDHPGMHGAELNNYHYWSNIIVAETSRIFNLPVFQVQFQYSTVLLSILFGLLLIGLCREIGASNSFCRWSLFFFYFGGDAIYWFIAIMRSGPIFAMSSLEDGIGFFANYPRALAVIVSFAAMILMFNVRKRFSYSFLIVTALLFSSLSGIKIYIGFFCYIGIISLAVYDILRYRRFTVFWIGIATILFLLPIYISANTDAGKLYYTGFWRAQNFIVQPYLNLIRLEMARVIFEADHKWIHVMIFNIGFSAIYFLLIFGTKIVAVFNIKKSYRQLSTGFHYFFVPAIIISIIVGFFFNQETGGANSFNFIASAYIYISFYAALFCSYITGSTRNGLRIGFIFLIVILTIPRACNRIYRNIDNIMHHKGFSISSNILEASSFVRNSTDFDAMILIDNRSFSWDTSGPVFSMLLDRPMFFSGQDFLTQFKASDGEMTQRKAIRDIIVSDSNILNVASQIKKSRIDFILTDPNRTSIATTSAVFFEQWYRNLGILVIKVHPEMIPVSIFEEAK